MLPLLLSRICGHFNSKCNFDELFHDWIAGVVLCKCTAVAGAISWVTSALGHLGAIPGIDKCPSAQLH